MTFSDIHMPSKKRSELLKNLHAVTTDLRSFFRAGHALSEAEQLFIENRLMILQIEYSLWAKDKLKTKERAGGKEEHAKAG